MYILGLNLLHDTSATLIKDNVVIGSVEEERFNGLKHTNMFPKQSIKWLLEKEGLTIEDVEVVLSYKFSEFCTNQNPFEENTIYKSGDKDIKTDNNLLFKNIMKSLKDFGINDFVEIDHHLSHAAAVYLSGFSEASIAVLDGRGENYSTSLYHFKDNKFELVDRFSILDSIGHLYTYVTKLCGLYTDRGQEGKTMGLAAHGKFNSEIQKIFQEIIIYLGDGKYSIDRNKMYKLDKYKDKPFSQNSKDLAYCLQKEYEKLLNYIIKNLIRKTKCNNLVLSGGVALNCNANGKIVNELNINNMYVQPAANDAGTSLGAALIHYYNSSEDIINIHSDVYLGPEYSNEYIEERLKLFKLKYVASEDIYNDTAKILANGEVIGWFQGRMEFGPRALGNRSILADPRSKSMKDKVNLLVKQREEWRPFAPSILKEDARDYFNCKINSPHMNISFDTRKEFVDNIPAAIHVDNSARIQTVVKNANDKYYKLLKEFKNITGIPVLLNTSFNGRNPIVMTPDDAIKTFYSTGLDALVLGDFIIRKENN